MGRTSDALVQVGTNLSMVRLAAQAEMWLKKPVIAINTATYWHAPARQWHRRSTGRLRPRFCRAIDAVCQGKRRWLIRFSSRKLQQGKFFVVPGAQDMIAAAIIDKVGFDLVYGTGFWLTASASGLPDAGIVGYSEMLDRMRTLVRSSRAAVIADADTGYGGLLNVHHTVRGYEDAGVTAIQIEDQEFPKKMRAYAEQARDPGRTKWLARSRSQRPRGAIPRIS